MKEKNAFSLFTLYMAHQEVIKRKRGRPRKNVPPRPEHVQEAAIVLSHLPQGLPAVTAAMAEEKEKRAVGLFRESIALLTDLQITASPSFRAVVCSLIEETTNATITAMKRDISHSVTCSKEENELNKKILEDVADFRKKAKEIEDTLSEEKKRRATDSARFKALEARINASDERVKALELQK
jgi:hypothetical protein